MAGVGYSSRGLRLSTILFGPPVRRTAIPELVIAIHGAFERGVDVVERAKLPAFVRVVRYYRLLLQAFHVEALVKSGVVLGHHCTAPARKSRARLVIVAVLSLEHAFEFGGVGCGLGALLLDWQLLARS